MIKNMKKIKVLNLYAGIGGNRKLWPSDKIEVTAVELNKSIAAIYKDFFQNDSVIIEDAHQYLLEHYKEFDFIWASPPCPTHSRIRFMASKRGDYGVKYPDMKLYEEIIFLKHFAKCKWVIENVKSYYKPLVRPSVYLDRNYFWSNFPITEKEFEYGGDIKKGHVKELQEIKGVNIDKYKLEGRRKDSAIRSYVNPKVAQYIFNCAFKTKQITLEDL